MRVVSENNDANADDQVGGVDIARRVVIHNGGGVVVLAKKTHGRIETTTDVKKRRRRRFFILFENSIIPFPSRAPPTDLPRTQRRGKKAGAGLVCESSSTCRPFPPAGREGGCAGIKAA